MASSQWSNWKLTFAERPVERSPQQNPEHPRMPWLIDYAGSGATWSRERECFAWKRRYGAENRAVDVVKPKFHGQPSRSFLGAQQTKKFSAVKSASATCR